MPVRVRLELAEAFRLRPRRPRPSVFTGLTVWDAQRLKEMAVALPEGQVGSYAIVGALSLYLDFVNLFLFLLRFPGDRRE